MKHDMSQCIEEEIILYFQSVQVLHMKMHVHCVCVIALTLNKISEEYCKLAKRLANTHSFSCHILIQAAHSLYT